MSDALLLHSLLFYVTVYDLLKHADDKLNICANDVTVYRFFYSFLWMFCMAGDYTFNSYNLLIVVFRHPTKIVYDAQTTHFSMLFDKIKKGVGKIYKKDIMKMRFTMKKFYWMRDTNEDEGRKPMKNANYMNK